MLILLLMLLTFGLLIAVLFLGAPSGPRREAGEGWRTGGPPAPGGRTAPPGEYRQG